MRNKAVIIVSLLLIVFTACKNNEKTNSSSVVLKNSSITSSKSTSTSASSKIINSTSTSVSKTINSSSNTSKKSSSIVQQVSSKPDNLNTNILNYFTDTTFKTAFESALKIALPNRNTYTVQDLKDLGVNTVAIKNGKGGLRVTLYNISSLDLYILEYGKKIAQGTDINYTQLNYNFMDGLEKIDFIESLFYTASVEGGGIIDSEMFSSFSNLKNLNIENYTCQKISLNPIGKLTNLESFCVSSDFDGDFNFLTSLTKLKFLLINNGPINDLVPISKLKSLESLSFYNVYSSNLNFSLLKNLTNLNYICLYRLKLDNSNVFDEVIPQLQKLKKMKISGCYDTNISNHAQFCSDLKNKITALNSSIVFVN